MVKQEIRSRILDIALAAVATLVLATVLFGIVDRRSTAGVVTKAPYVLIDAGHGGEDGGAEGADGTLEKDINLAISLPLGDMLRVMGYTVLQTRTTDTMVDAVGDTLRERKVSDIHNRLSQIQQADFTVSIHQNKFPQSRYSGAQVFYSTATTESHELAASIRTSVLSLLQPSNTRELKKGENSVYLFAHATKPLVLVECGFLSNVEERERLKTHEYQLQMAFAIAGGILKR